jgi:Chaperone of endosialidase
MYGATNGTAVYGSEGGDGAGGYFITATGNGVRGVSANTSTSNDKAGVYGSNTSTGWAGYFDGPVRFPSAADVCTPTCASDIRLKKDVRPLTGTLEKLLQLHGVTFEWKQTDSIGHMPGTHTGLIAQEVEKVFPSWVGKDGEYKTVGIDQRESLALTVEALRDQQSEIPDLKARLKTVEDERRPVISMGPNLGIGIAGLAIAGAVLVGLRRRTEKSS